MKEFEKPPKALANRRRLAIVKYLKQNREAAVGEIARSSFFLAIFGGLCYS